MTELNWDGKYDDKGRKVAPPRIALPFQTVETVNESAADRDRNQDPFAGGRPTDWRNRLIWGDKYVLPSLLDEFAGKVELIYIDPPFDTGANFSYIATIPDDPDTEGDQGATFTKEPRHSGAAKGVSIAVRKCVCPFGLQRWPLRESGHG
jgi:adenine-specific DNA-methyltransferase